MAADEDSVEYSWTLTTHGRFRKKDPGDQFDELKKVLLELPKYVRATIVAECHKDYSVHCHGVVRFRLDHMHSKYKMCPSKSLFDLFRCHPFIGHMKMDQITEHGQWKMYLEKDMSNTYKYLVRNPLIRDDLKMFDSWSPFSIYNVDLSDDSLDDSD